MKACARAAGKLARYEHIGWKEWPQRRCCAFHSGSIAMAGSDTGRSRASCCAAVGVRARVGPAVMGGTVLCVCGTDPGRCDRPRSLAPGSALSVLPRWSRRPSAGWSAGWVVVSPDRAYPSRRSEDHAEPSDGPGGQGDGLGRLRGVRSALSPVPAVRPSPAKGLPRTFSCPRRPPPPRLPWTPRFPLTPRKRVGSGTPVPEPPRAPCRVSARPPGESADPDRQGEERAGSVPDVMKVNVRTGIGRDTYSWADAYRPLRRSYDTCPMVSGSPAVRCR